MYARRRIPSLDLWFQEHFLSDALLRDIMERMGRDLADAADNYLDLPDNGRHSALGIRMGPGLRDIKNLATDEQLFPPIDYDSIGDTNPNPSIRDQEYLQHSSMWGKYFGARHYCWSQCGVTWLRFCLISHYQLALQASINTKFGNITASANVIYSGVTRNKYLNIVVY